MALKVNSSKWAMAWAGHDTVQQKTKVAGKWISQEKELNEPAEEGLWIKHKKSQADSQHGMLPCASVHVIHWYTCDDVGDNLSLNVKTRICLWWIFMIHCVSFVACESVSAFSRYCWCCLSSCVCVSECACVFEQIQDTHSERPQADGVDAYLWQTGLTLHTGCLQFTHTHFQPNWQVAQAPEEQEFPALLYEPLGSPQQQTESGWREM